MSKKAWSPGPQEAVGEDVRVRVAAVAGDGVDRLDLLGAELEEEPLGVGDDLAARSRRGGATRRSARRPRRRSPAAWSSSAISSSVLILRAASITCEPSVTCDAARAAAPRASTMSVMSMPSGSPVEAALGAARRRCARRAVGDAGLVGHRAAHRRHARRGSSRRAATARRADGGLAAEPKSQRIGSPAARQQGVASVLVAGPLADVGAGDVADVVRVEQQQRAEVGLLQLLLGAREAIARGAAEVDPLLPVDTHRRATRCDVHARSPGSI